jgi:RNA polymerase sigma-70 factor (ECF subfamily)
MPEPLVPADAERVAVASPPSMGGFYEGSRAAMAELYEDHFATVERAVGRVLDGADQETVIHEVFLRLISDASLRASFRGGSLRAWIATVAHNHALDYRRRREREHPSGSAEDLDGGGEPARFEASIEARQLVARFREEWLPHKWRPIFDVRFLEELPQSEAARRLGIHRTTLLYQELRIRALLRKFLLRQGFA